MAQAPSRAIGKSELRCAIGQLAAPRLNTVVEFALLWSEARDVEDCEHDVRAPPALRAASASATITIHALIELE